MSDVMKTKNIFSLKRIVKEKSVVTLHPERAKELGIYHRKIMSVSFGSCRQQVSFLTSLQVDISEIHLAENTLSSLRIPDYLLYEVIISNNEITLGPYIGLLLYKKGSHLTPKRLERLLAYTYEYNKINGAIVVFALDGVKTQNQVVEGFCYDPCYNKWNNGLYPYPTAIYRKIGLTEEWKSHFLSVLGNRIFNNYYFNKWDTYQWLKEFHQLKIFLPDTNIYHNPESVIEMLKIFNKLYVKPVAGMRGNNIYKIHQEKDTVRISSFQNNSAIVQSFNNDGKLREYLSSVLQNGKYLVQQGLDLIEYNGSIIDFRIIMQKDRSFNWRCSGIIGRYGLPNSIVSNISKGGSAFKIQEFLKNHLGMSPGEIFIFKERVILFCKEACHVLDELGLLCGTLGLDIGIDKKGHLWLIEINNRDPDPTIALDVQNKLLYYKIKANCLHFAKGLAGFK